MKDRGIPIAPFLMFFGSVLSCLSATASQSVDGLWQSRGYGYVLSVKGPLLDGFEITSATCIKGFTARRSNAAPARWGTAFKGKEGTYFLQAGNGSDHAVLHLEDSVPDIQIDRIPRMPLVCEHLAENTPISNFEVFTRTWAENYISFELRHADWGKIVAAYRPKITAQTTPAQLFEVFEAMIKPLGDLHTYIAAPSLKRSTPTFWRSGTNRMVTGNIERFARRERPKLLGITNQGYLQRPPNMFCNRQLQYGHIDDSIGYLRILSFGGYSRHHDLSALESAMDKIFSEPIAALVIDMRLSFGGSDELALAIARRLTNRGYLAFTIFARSGPGTSEGWTHGDAIVVQPGNRPGFRGPVVELTSSITMSAAETFSEALMARTPHTIRIGESTQGVFCDILERHLPNGWTFGLPNAVYRAADGRAFDVQGIPPEITVPVFTDADRAAETDPAMAKAVEILTAATRQQNW